MTASAAAKITKRTIGKKLSSCLPIASEEGFAVGVVVSVGVVDGCCVGVEVGLGEALADGSTLSKAFDSIRVVTTDTWLFGELK